MDCADFNSFVHSVSGDHLALKVEPPSSVSPRDGAATTTLPTIINTSHSPDRSPPKSAAPARPSRSPSRNSSTDNGSGTLSDLTDMLGGAIDEIQRQNSKDATPLPTLSSESSLAGVSIMSSSTSLHDDFHRKLSLSPSSHDATPLNTSTPLVPPSPSRTPGGRPAIPIRTGSIHNEPPPSQSMPPPPLPFIHQIRTPSFSLSLKHETVGLSPTSTGTGPRPWPTAMMFGNIKGLRYPGDRATAYAKSINELALAESGLSEWCMIFCKRNCPPKRTRKLMGSLFSYPISNYGSFADQIPVPRLSWPSDHLILFSSLSCSAHRPRPERLDRL